MFDRWRDLLSRPVSDEWRRPVFVSAVAVLCVAAMVLLFASDRGGTPNGKAAEPRLSKPPPAPTVETPTARPEDVARGLLKDRKQVVREYATDFLRWERRQLPTSRIRHATAVVKRELGRPPRFTPATSPRDVGTVNGKLWIRVYLEGDLAQVRVRLKAVQQPKPKKGKRPPPIPASWESFGVETARVGDRWAVTAHNR